MNSVLERFVLGFSMDLRYNHLTNYEWILEIKYIKEKDKGSFKTVREKAIEQLNSYAESRKIKYGLITGKIKKGIIIITGKSEVYMELVRWK